MSEQMVNLGLNSPIGPSPTETSIGLSTPDRKWIQIDENSHLHSIVIESFMPGEFPNQVSFLNCKVRLREVTVKITGDQ